MPLVDFCREYKCGQNVLISLYTHMHLSLHIKTKLENKLFYFMYMRSILNETVDVILFDKKAI